MKKLLAKFRNDNSGFIVSVEMLFICVILVVGISAGLAALRAAVATELSSLGAAILNLDPGYNIVSVGSATGSANGTLVTHVNSGLNIGEANQVSTNTTVGTDKLGQGGSFPLPITP
jgi:Flp pilus assembly pilin Flp